MKKLNIAFIAFVTILLTSCAMQKKESRPPQWYLNLSANSDNASYYAKASTIDRNNAIATALADIASKIHSKVSSSGQDIYTSYNDNGLESFQKSYDKNVSVATDDIYLGDYQIIQEEYSYPNYYVYIKIDKSNLLKYYKEIVHKKELEITQIVNKANGQSELESLKTLKSIDCNSIDKDLFILTNVSDPSIASAFKQRCVKLKEAITEKESQVKFFVSTDGESNSLKGYVEQKIIKQGYNVTSNRENASHIVYIKAINSKEKTGNLYYTRTTTGIKIENTKTKNTIESSKVYSCASYLSFESAMDSCYKKMTIF